MSKDPREASADQLVIVGERNFNRAEGGREGAAENERGLEARLKLCCGWRFGIRPRRPRREDLATRQVSALGDSPLCTVIVLQILVFS